MCNTVILCRMYVHKTKRASERLQSSTRAMLPLMHVQSSLLRIISDHTPIRLNLSSLNTNDGIIHGLCDRSHSLRSSWHVDITSLVADSTISYLTRRGTHLSTAETIAAVPAPNTSSNDPFFSASTRSPIVIFLSDTLKLDGRPGMDLPSIWPRHRFNTLNLSWIP